MVESIQVRATINFGGLRRDTVVRVDPSDPYMETLLAHEMLVPVEAEATEPVSPPEPVPENGGVGEEPIE